MHKASRDSIPADAYHRLPVLPLKEVVFFPHMLFPLLVGRESSLRAVQEAMLLNKLIFVTAQKDVTQEEPGKDDLYRIGVVARILQLLRLPNGLVKVLAEGVARARISRFLQAEEHLEVRVELLDDASEEDVATRAAMRRVASAFRDYVRLHRALPEEILFGLEGLEGPQHLADFVAAHVQRETKIKQHILELPNAYEALTYLAELLEHEKDILDAERDLDDKVRGRIQRTQRNYWLQEQMRAIQEELGDEFDADNDIAGLREKVKKCGMPKEAEEKAYEELDRLRNTAPLSPEATVIRNYIDWLIALPWVAKTEDVLEVQNARMILDEDHHGLENPKKRILEQLAVLQLVQKMKGPILCLVGPPGVGKTSLAKSISRAMGRNFVRMSLGGVRDEAEIRGHRRTYIGSMPGRIIQSMKRAKSINPVFLLDEIDKMTFDFHGDPAAALLEVLDPEQNKVFNDHYLEVDYDLSQVLFITTANVRSQIPEPLLDRMELIDLPGYLEHDKLEIAKGFLLPKLLREHGLTAEQLRFSDAAILKIIREYTREAGVRNLERELASVCRKTAYAITTKGELKRREITPRALEVDLGVPKYPQRPLTEQRAIGTATGLAWTRYGGDVLDIEVSLMPGKGNLVLTGKLGDVMKESARAALSFIRTNAAKLGIRGDFWKDMDLHIHIPEGSIPKDGPSAGITLVAAMVSALSNRAVRRDIALTGEITLRGSVLAIGGLNEKMLAAQRLGIKKVIIPQENAKDLKELPAPLRKGIEVITVKHVEEVLQLVLCEKEPGEQLPAQETSKTTTSRRRRMRKRMPSRPAAIN
ncbi:endopeptidase La [candidate division KSB1 bacterium]|nr:MAG: endopeptidase La [candidate division KSB1 bacterium]MCE7941558.1 endopeptidase La [Chlorobi bacterium CHB1]